MKRKKLFFVFIVSIFIPCYVQAYELKCDEGLYKFEDRFSCRITGEKDKSYDSMTGTISTNENVSCSISTVGQGLLNTSNERKKFTISGTMNMDIIAILQCQVVKKVSVDDLKTQITINDFKYKETNAEKENSEILRSNYINLEKYEVTTTATTKEVKPRSTANSNSLLKVLAADNLNFTFSRFITEYNIEVLYEVDKLNLKYAPANDNARVRIVGNTTLNVGENMIDIYVTSPDGVATTCYTLTVKRLARGEEIYYPESDSTLSKLEIEGYPINFDKNVFDYTIHVGSNVNSIKVDAVSTYNGAIVNIANTSNLQNGKIATVTVTSKDGTKESLYKIKIQKDAPKKDYTPYYFLGGCGVVIILIIFLFIRSSQKKKNDPLLKLKKEKRKSNKGNKFDISDVPEAQSQIAIPKEASSEQAQVSAEPNVVNLDKVSTIPTQIDEVQDLNLNKVTPVRENLDLHVSKNAAPIPSPGEAPSVPPQTMAQEQPLQNKEVQMQETSVQENLAQNIASQPQVVQEQSQIPPTSPIVEEPTEIFEIND